MMAYSTCKVHEQRRAAVGSGSTETGTDGHLKGQMLQTLLQDIQGAPRWRKGFEKNKLWQVAQKCDFGVYHNDLQKMFWPAPSHFICIMFAFYTMCNFRYSLHFDYLPHYEWDLVAMYQTHAGTEREDDLLLLLLCSQILLCLSLGAVMRWEEKQHETASRLNYACLHLLTEDKSVRPLQCHHTNTHTLMHTHTSIHAKLTLLMQFIGPLGPYQTISLSCWVWFYSYGTQS